MHLISGWICPSIKYPRFRSAVLPAAFLFLLLPALSSATELKPFSATYTISRGAFKAERTIKLTHEGSDYLLTAKTTLKGLASLSGRGTAVETSRFQLIDDRIVPILYTAHDGTDNPDRVIQIEFNFSGGVARSRARGSEHLLNLDTEVLDPLSFELMARIDLRNGAPEPHYIVHEGDQLRQYWFHREGTETIEINRKKLNTVRYLVDRQSSRQLYYWLSPELDHLMVQLRQVHEGKVKVSGILTWSSLSL